MPESIFDFFRCPRCATTPLQYQHGRIICKCGAEFGERDGILNLLDENRAEVITPFQRLMEAPAVASVYEHFWRPFGYYLASSRRFSEEIRRVLRFQEAAEQRRVLDVACGTGVFTRPMASRCGGTVVGVDLSWAMLRRARRIAERERMSNILLLRGTVARLPFVAGTFSLVNCCGALHLFDQPAVALAEIARVLAPEGYLTIQTTIRPGRTAGWTYLLERFIRFGFFREDELNEKIRLAGFKVLGSERHRISCTVLARRVAG